MFSLHEITLFTLVNLQNSTQCVMYISVVSKICFWDNYYS